MRHRLRGARRARSDPERRSGSGFGLLLGPSLPDGFQSRADRFRRRHRVSGTAEAI